mmetsp:Transcript_45124/g.116725  ORF Transcript_45124/g.116725 Transcript_45124/m.116725 type:complete len:347 (-) Transcript_45124:204-1244(-)
MVGDMASRGGDDDDCRPPSGKYSLLSVDEGKGRSLAASPFSSSTALSLPNAPIGGARCPLKLWRAPLFFSKISVFSSSARLSDLLLSWTSLYSEGKPEGAECASTVYASFLPPPASSVPPSSPFGGEEEPRGVGCTAGRPAGGGGGGKVPPLRTLLTTRRTFARFFVMEANSRLGGGGGGGKGEAPEEFFWPIDLLMTREEGFPFGGECPGLLSTGSFNSLKKKFSIPAISDRSFSSFSTNAFVTSSAISFTIGEMPSVRNFPRRFLAPFTASKPLVHLFLILSSRVRISSSSTPLVGASRRASSNKKKRSRTGANSKLVRKCSTNWKRGVWVSPAVLSWTTNYEQ